MSVYVEDINDNEPVFIDAPYTVTVDEITSTGKLSNKMYYRILHRTIRNLMTITLITGSTLFNEILAKDNDKFNTPNSDVHYSIVGGNERGKFSLEDNNPASLLLRNPLDYDSGDTNFVLTILASVSRCYIFFFFFC